MLYKPDLNAPRFRPKAMSLMNMTTFNKFKEKYPDVELTYPQFEEIVETYGGVTWAAAVENRDGAELPEGLGNIFVGSCKRARKRRNVDFKTSAELGVIVSHKNWGSNNKIAKIFYSNYAPRYRFKGRELWSFKGTRDFTRAVSAEFPKSWQKYIVIENVRSIARLFQYSLRRDAAKRAHESFDYESYNEFDIA